MRNKGLIFLLFLFTVCYSQTKSPKIPNITSNNNSAYIAGNEIMMWVANNGMTAHDPRNDASGFYWPGGEYAIISAIYVDGIVWGGKIDGNIKVGGSTYRYGLQAGKILTDGTADDPSLEKYRVYKIKRGVKNKDYEEWPVEDGAPWVDVDGDGIFTRGIDEPEFPGDEVLWYVMNDLDSARTKYLHGSMPIGIELQVTIWASVDLPDVVYKKYVLINKSNTVIEDMYIAQWSDPDLGYSHDDFVGCDTTLSLGYCYNEDNNDQNYYGINPPALGYTILQGPLVKGNGNDIAINNGIKIPGYKNLPMTSFLLYINSTGTLYADPMQGVTEGGEQMYNNLQGRLRDGSYVIDPTNGAITIYCTAGDPIKGTGWYQGKGWPGGPFSASMRFIASCGPFNMQPADTQEVIIAVHMAGGEDNLNSLQKLIDQSRILHRIHQDQDWLKYSIIPKLEANSGDGEITLWWDAESESIELTDYRLLFDHFDDTTYNFEGYRLWQFSDSNGSDPVEINVFDLANGVTLLSNYITIEGIHVKMPVLKLPDKGIKRYLNITKDFYTGGKLLNGKKYYFGITAFAYSPNSRNQLLESEPVIVEVIPGQNPIDYSLGINPSDYLTGIQTDGISDAIVCAKIIDESKLTGSDYEIKIYGVFVNPYYSITNKTNSFQLADSLTNFSFDTLHSYIYDGLNFLVKNDSRDAILKKGLSKKSGIKNIIETADKNGELDTPGSIFYNLNSTGEWEVTTTEVNNKHDIENINYRDNLGLYDYEIRFTNHGSEYYTTSSILANDLSDGIKSTKRAPFEVWNVTNNERLTIKIHDWNFNGFWDKDNSSNWETIFAVDNPAYIEPLPTNSGKIPASDVFITNFIISGELPEEGTVIRINTWKPLKEGDVFIISTPKTNFNDLAAAKERINEITVFPNPFYDNSQLYHSERKVTFTKLPDKVTIRIFTLAGVFVTRLEKDSETQWLDWDLKNKHGELVGGGIYLAYIEMPGIGEKILKIAVIL